jgi:membrane associated rhomboid family serine protease
MSERSPTLETLLLFALVFAIQSLVSLLPGIASAFLFTLGPDFLTRPWSLVTSVYAHASLPHLLSNALALALVGFILERSTTRARFHLYFLTTGVLAGLVEVLLGGFLAVLLGGRVPLVLGASGAVFALYGYAFTGNRLTDTIVDAFSIPANVQLAIFVAVAALVTWATGSPGVALLAHFTGFLLGLVAGRLGLLDAPDHATDAHDRNATF